MNLVRVRRALISVSDKSGIVDLARAMQSEFSVEIISTGGTSTLLKQAGVLVQDVAAVTGFPEMMDGRLKTLHPVVHGGLLGIRANPEHQAAMHQHGIAPIDLLIVNLYPFEKVTSQADCPVEQAIENIDIGGPAMIRSAAKNHADVVVITNASQYADLLAEMRRHGGGTGPEFRRKLARQAFLRTSTYDAMIYNYLATLPEVAADVASSPTALAAEFPDTLIPVLQKKQSLRYGENPHQAAAFYAQGRGDAGLATLRQLHGKELSYINLLDADAAATLVAEFHQPAATVIKHANPCGCAVGKTLAEAFNLAYAGDPVAAFGGIVALNDTVDVVTAKNIADGKRFLEVLIAPAYAPQALEILRQRWADCRILELPGLKPGLVPEGLAFRSLWGAMLVQRMDVGGFDRSACRVVSQHQPTESQWNDLECADLIGKHVKSNAITLVHGGQLLAAGAGQMSRVTSCRLAVDLALRNGHGAKLKGAAAASDAFFPFADGPQILLDAGIRCLVEPGGSKRDQETIDLCDQHGVALVFTGRRHFLH